MKLKVLKDEPFPVDSESIYFHFKKLWKETAKKYYLAFDTQPINNEIFNELFFEIDNWSVEFFEANQKYVVPIAFDKFALPEVMKFYVELYKSAQAKSSSIEKFLAGYFMKNFSQKVDEINLAPLAKIFPSLNAEIKMETLDKINMLCRIDDIINENFSNKK